MKKYNSIQEETNAAIDQLALIIKKCDEGQVMTILIQSYANANDLAFEEAQEQLASNLIELLPTAAKFYMTNREGS